MQGFLQGNAAAFDSLFERHAGPVHRYLQRITGNAAAADDLTQATFLSMVNARGRFRRGSRVRPWLYAIATNAARDWHRRARPEELTRDGTLPADLASEDPAPADSGLEREVQTAVTSLPDSLRACLVMHRFEGLPLKEIAQALDLTETAVKLRLHRAYERLRTALAPLRKDL